MQLGIKKESRLWITGTQRLVDCTAGRGKGDQEPGLPGASYERQYGDNRTHKDADAAPQGFVAFHFLPSFL